MDDRIKTLTVNGTLSWEEREAIRQDLFSDSDPFIAALPKVELHIHIEGTLTPELRWNLAQRNGISLGLKRNGITYTTLEQLKASYVGVQPRPGHEYDAEEEKFTFFEIFYGSLEVLMTRQDFHDLAMNYFEHAAAMNVRYCEPFFDPQSHTKRGVTWETMMEGFREAQVKAERDLNVVSKWILCFLRDMSPESAMQHYEAALPYRDMIVGIGLDSNEYMRPPSLFADVFIRARADGFRLTCHCDVATDNTQEHIRQVPSEVGGDGANRLDHGINAVERPKLMQLILEQRIGMVLCPWAYLRHEPEDEVFPRIRALYDYGIKFAIGSDDPAYMEDVWMAHNLLLVKKIGRFDNRDIEKLSRNAIEMSWAPDSLKLELLTELDAVVKAHAERSIG